MDDPIFSVMKSKISKYLKEIEIFTSEEASEIEQFRIKFLGRKGIIIALFNEFKLLDKEEKKELGQFLNEFKNKVSQKVKELKRASSDKNQPDFKGDLSRPSRFNFEGSRHPVSLVINYIISIFEKIGFGLLEGPEIEDDWHNFTALNFPEEHPARNMHDTFFVQKNPDWALRTHTSSLQIRVMENQRFPIRIISPGRVFRNETISARSHYMFHQVEGLYVDKGVSFADLKQTLLHFAREFFGRNIKIRLRPSYFPFTEPSAEMDVYWGLNSEVDYHMTKGTGWLEVLGCGMVDPQVLKNCNIDPEDYSGYAFGMGVERMVLHRFKMNDIRMLFENDIRMLKQFGSTI